VLLMKDGLLGDEKYALIFEEILALGLVKKLVDSTVPILEN